MYGLTPAGMDRITAAALAGLPGVRDRYVSVVARDGEPLAAVARAIEREVFESTFGNDADTMATEYGPYEQRSLFFVVLDTRLRRPAGAARVIQGDGPRGLKTLDDAPAHIGVDSGAIVAAHGLDDGGVCWDFATAAVRPEYRGGRSALAVSSLLYRTFLRAGTAAGAEHVVVMLDRRAYRNMRLLGAKLTPLAGSGPFAYLGSPENHALYVRFGSLPVTIRAQARRLRRPGRAGAEELRARGLRLALARHVAAGVSRRVATGRGLDHAIVMS